MRVDLPALVVLGPTCSGKTTISCALEQTRIGTSVFDSGFELRSPARRLGMRQGEYLAAMRASDSIWLGRQAADRAVQNSDRVLSFIAVGFRSEADLWYFRSRFPRSLFAWIDAPLGIRWRRSAVREGFRGISMAEFAAYDLSLWKPSPAALRESCDMRLQNESRADLQACVSTLGAQLDRLVSSTLDF